MRPTLGLSALAGLLLVAGVTAGCAKPGGGGPATPGADDTAARAAFRARAEQVAHAWTASGNVTAWQHGFVPVSALTVLTDGDGTEATKVALTQGWFVLRAPLPLPPPRGTVTFADGGTMSVPLQTAEDAFGQIATAPPPCPDPTATPTGAPEPSPGPTDSDGTSSYSPPVSCVTLAVTAIRLGSDQMQTSRGTATVPMWQFTVTGLDKPVERIAVDPSMIGKPLGVDSPGVQIEGVTGAESLQSVADTAVTFRIGIGSCDTDIEPLLYEDAHTVVVGARRTTAPGVCDMMLRIVPLHVTLAAPLGGRVVLDVSTGDPLIVSTLP